MEYVEFDASFKDIGKAGGKHGVVTAIELRQRFYRFTVILKRSN